MKTTYFKKSSLVLVLLASVIVLSGCLPPKRGLDVTEEDSQEQIRENLGIEATPEATATPATDTDTGNTQSATAQNFTIDGAQSSASYTVKKEFLAQPTQDVIGTAGLSGSFSYDPLTSKVGGEFVVDLTSLESGSEDRDDHLKTGNLETDTYTTATFVPTSSTISGEVAEGEELSFNLNGNLTIKETTKPVSFRVSAMLENGMLKGTATTTIKASDFEVEMPSVLELYTVNDNVVLSVDFVATLAN